MADKTAIVAYINANVGALHGHPAGGADVGGAVVAADVLSLSEIDGVISVVVNRGIKGCPKYIFAASALPAPAAPAAPPPPKAKKAAPKPRSRKRKTTT